MKVVIEYADKMDAMVALSGQTYLQLIEEFEDFLSNLDACYSAKEIRDKWSRLKDLYKV